MGLLRVVAMMVVQVGVTVDGRVVCTTIAIIVSVRGSPYLALLGSTGRAVILVGEAMGVVSSLSTPLLLLLVGGHPPTLVREVTVVPTTAHVVMRVVAAALSSNLSADWRWCLI